MLLGDFFVHVSLINAQKEHKDLMGVLVCRKVGGFSGELQENYIFFLV